MPAQLNRYLVGTAEIAEMLEISRQRADQLTRTTGFPEPVRLVLPLDERTRDTMVALEASGDFPGGDAVTCYENIIATAHRMPEQPRLWRAADIERWAEETGRT